MLDKRQFAIGFVIAFVILVVYIYQNNDQISSTIINDGSTGILWYFLTNPAYVLILFSVIYINSDNVIWRNFLGSVMIIVAADIVSYPRFLTSGIGNEAALLASSDGIIIKRLLSEGFAYNTAFTIYYLVFPIALMVGALAILGIHNFFKFMRKGG